MPFHSKYTISDKVLDCISRITAGREIIERSRIIPKWEMGLKKEARVHNAHASTSIEGNRLTLEQVKALSEHKEVTASFKDQREVLNYLEALDAISHLARRKLDVKLLLSIHKIITKNTLRDPGDVGLFRNRQVFVGKRVFDGTQLKEVVEYMPPDTNKVPVLVEEFLAWLNSEKSKNIHPVILAGIAHYEVARIHPFIDGNGRVARLLATLILYKSGFDHRRFFALDDYYDADRQGYYGALKTVTEQKGDLTLWLEYFSEGVLDSVAKVRHAIERIGAVRKIKGQEQIELTQKQIEIIEKIRDKGKVTNRDLRAMFKVSRQAILKEISKLVGAGLIKIVGKGRSAHYAAMKTESLSRL
jgi:Fic family protein